MFAPRAECRDRINMPTTLKTPPDAAIAEIDRELAEIDARAATAQSLASLEGQRAIAAEREHLAKNHVAHAEAILEQIESAIKTVPQKIADLRLHDGRLEWLAAGAISRLVELDESVDALRSWLETAPERKRCASARVREARARLKAVEDEAAALEEKVREARAAIKSAKENSDD